ncbi:hypothetical protein [Virgibacillus halodenitrificans]|uniref:hypothetical protein n=1 Tax=Virgibacillus halodenitrificans TaxID=1482 RepID=UPI0003170286|nr:hypothetical protein [Virgibacillus halodenitrificans]
MEEQINERKQVLINKLNRLGVSQTADGRDLAHVSLYRLEWTHIDEKNKAARAYGG